MYINTYTSYGFAQDRMLAIGFLLEIPTRGFLFQWNPLTNEICVAFRYSVFVHISSFEKEIPSGGSRAGDTSPKVALRSPSRSASPLFAICIASIGT